MKLPEKFEKQMRDQLNESYDDFLKTYGEETHRGIRVNTLKISVEEFLKITPFELEPIPWTEDGFYIKDIRPAKHPHYFAGLYYIQEPSAMLPAVVLNPTHDDVVLDLCAAPGGKSMQLAAMMENRGLLISNDISSNRLRALIRNAELLGVKNLVVLNEKQDKIKDALYHKVDKLLIDAPCSGEGMFKKHVDAISAYEHYDVEACVSMQEEILDDILHVLNGQGEVVYSTCTFNTFENENMIRYAMNQMDLDLKEIPKAYGFVPGIGLEEVSRLYPHLIRGEGHFAAHLVKQSEKESVRFDKSIVAPPETLIEFMKVYLNQPLKGHFKVIKDKVFLLPESMLSFSSVKVVKTGWYIGELKKNRFEPSHAFALGLNRHMFKQTINFESDSIEVIKYLKCETIFCEGHKGYNLICVDGYPIGWGKWANGKLKNLYPSAWRLL